MIYRKPVNRLDGDKLKKYTCLDCSWDKRTKSVLDGIRCPKCKKSTVVMDNTYREEKMHI